MYECEFIEPLSIIVTYIKNQVLAAPLYGRASRCRPTVLVVLWDFAAFDAAKLIVRFEVLTT